MRSENSAEAMASVATPTKCDGNIKEEETYTDRNTVSVSAYSSAVQGVTGTSSNVRRKKADHMEAEMPGENVVGTRSSAEISSAGTMGVASASMDMEPTKMEAALPVSNSAVQMMESQGHKSVNSQDNEPRNAVLDAGRESCEPEEIGIAKSPSHGSSQFDQEDKQLMLRNVPRTIAAGNTCLLTNS